MPVLQIAIDFSIRQKVLIATVLGEYKSINRMECSLNNLKWWPWNKCIEIDGEKNIKIFIIIIQFVIVVKWWKIKSHRIPKIEEIRNTFKVFECWLWSMCAIAVGVAELRCKERQIIKIELKFVMSEEKREIIIRNEKSRKNDDSLEREKDR